MKGETTVIVTQEQMVDIVQSWWKGMTYSSGSKVVSLKENDYCGYVLTLNEVIKEVEK